MKNNLIMLACSLIGAVHAAAESIGPKSLQVLAREVAISHGLPWSTIPLDELRNDIAVQVIQDKKKSEASVDAIDTRYSHAGSVQRPREKRNKKAVRRILNLHDISERRASLARFTVENPKAWSAISIIPCACCIQVCCVCTARAYCPDAVETAHLLSGLSIVAIVPGLFSCAPTIDNAVIRLMTKRSPRVMQAWNNNIEQAQRVLDERAPRPAPSMDLEEHLKID